MTTPTPSPAAPPTTGPLVDAFGRTFDYARIAVNERCNLRCVYCMPAEGMAFKEGEALLSTDEIGRLVRVLAGLGVRKVRFTGGEPLLRRDIVPIVADAASVDGVESVCLTTNGILFEANAEALRDAGLTHVNISLDTLRADRFATITRRTGVERVLAAVHQAVALGFPAVKVNVVAMRGFNDDEIGAFAALTATMPITVRFIELMPFDSHQIWKRGHFFGAAWIVERLEAAYPALTNVAGSRTEHHAFRLPDHVGTVAVIPAYSRDLCGACNRLRITADGKIRNCLYARRETDLIGAMRGGADDVAIERALRGAMWAKASDGWQAQRDPDGDDARGSMTQIGG